MLLRNCFTSFSSHTLHRVQLSHVLVTLSKAATISSSALSTAINISAVGVAERFVSRSRNTTGSEKLLKRLLLFPQSLTYPVPKGLMAACWQVQRWEGLTVLPSKEITPCHMALPPPSPPAPDRRPPPSPDIPGRPVRRQSPAWITNTMGMGSFCLCDFISHLSSRKAPEARWRSASVKYRQNIIVCKALSRALE